MAVITLTTDLGTKDYYVAALKGNIYKELPDVSIVDISHDIDKYNIAQAAFVIKNCFQDFPKSSIHILGVRPEKTESIDHVLAQYKGHFFVGADNGIFSLIFDHPPEKVVALNIRESLEGSLKRLQVDYVDSLIIHNPPSEYFDGNKNDHYEILEKLIEEGKIKAYGASIDTYEDMKLLMETTNSKVIEAFFNIFHQDTLRGFEMAKNKEVGIIVKIPLDSGWLTGKYNAESRFNDIRSRWSKEDIETRADLVNKVKSIIGIHGSMNSHVINII